MDNASPPQYDRSDQTYIDAAIRIAFLGFIIAWCFLIFQPFVKLILWSIILAVTAYPLHRWLTRILGGRKGLAAFLFAAIGIAILVLPGFLFAGSMIDTAKEFMEGVRSQVISIPPPDSSVEDWPMIGERIYAMWSKANANLEQFIRENEDVVTKSAGWLFHAIANIGIDLLITVIALVIAAILMLHADSAFRAAQAFFDRIIGRHGTQYAASSRDTIRTVVKGVVLVGLIQGILATIGFALIGIPLAGVWGLVVMILAIIQVPPTLLMIPLIVYAFSIAPTTAAIIFAVWSLFVGMSDNFLKPMLLGKGLKTPMLVILIGALGGMMLHGILGLFIGAVVMAIGYDIYQSWLRRWEIPEDEVPESQQ